MFIWVRAMWRKVMGMFGFATDKLNEDVYVVGATFDKSIGESVQTVKQATDAVASLMANKERKVVELKSVQADIQRLTGVKNGAEAKAKSVVAALKAKGVSEEDIKKDTDYMKCLAGYKDAASSLKDKEERSRSIDTDINVATTQISQYKVRLQEMQRNVQKLKTEKNSTIADIQIAKEEEKINASLAGIASDTSDKELQSVRDARDRVVSRAAVTRELTGNDARFAEDEFLKYSQDSEAASDFDKLVGLDSPTSAPTPERDKAKLPEV
jgi:phage shock protein A